MSRASFLRTGLCVALAILAMPTSVDAQLTGTMSETPFATGFSRDINQIRMMEYTQRMAKEFGIGKQMFGEMPENFLEGTDTKIEHPIKGMAWYMVTGLPPAVQQVYFEQVVDSEEARALLRKRAEIYHQGVENLEVLEDDRFRIVSSSSYDMDVPAGQTAEQFVKRSSPPSGSSGGNQVTFEVVEVDGKKKVRQSWTRRELYRIHDSMLFSGNVSEFFDMSLPDADGLTSSVSSERDMGFEAFIDRIPQSYKQLGWTMLSATSGTYAQQRDGEADEPANFRQAWIDSGTGIVKSVMFDVNQASGWLQFANENREYIRGEINIQPRANSQIRKQLEEVGGARSYFAPILKDDAAITLHTCFRLSEEAANVLRTGGEYLTYEVGQAEGLGAGAGEAAGVLASTLNAMADNQDVEFFAKLAHSPESDGLIFGGIRTHDNPQLLESAATLLESMLQNATGANLSGSMSKVDFDGQPALRLEIPAGAVETMKRDTSLALTHAWLMHVDGTLWFAIGGPNAPKHVLQSAERCRSNDSSGRAPLLTVHLDSDRWLDYPQDDPVGVGGLLRWLDENQAWFPPSPVMMSFGDQAKATPLIDKAIEYGGTGDLSFEVIADRQGILARLKFGERIGHYMVARMIALQDSVMASFPENAEEPVIEASPK